MYADLLQKATAEMCNNELPVLDLHAAVLLPGPQAHVDKHR